MTRLGLSLTGEQYGPDEIVDLAARAEAVGFDFVLVSDHFHPWLEEQGESPFVWTVLGAIARETDTVEFGTAVTCPMIRIHPANVAQAAATTAVAADDRFFLGVGTGERLNEHVTGDRWPEHRVRLEMLEEAVDVMRSLWTGEMVSHHGDHYTVENARLFTCPEEPPSVHAAAAGPITAGVVSEYADGLITTAFDEDVVEEFRSEGARDRPSYGQMTATYADDEDAALEVAHEQWRNGGLAGELGQELATPQHFDQACQLIEPEELAEDQALGPDADQYVETIEAFVDAGVDHVSIHQVNPEDDAFEGFFRLCGEEIIPAVS
jgi:G6PDH family F420-dependent oxidoreductase